jgi:hypothetical protein
MKRTVNHKGVEFFSFRNDNKPTFKECLMKRVDPLDSEYIDWKLEEKFEIISPQWKIDIKEEIIKEVKNENA